MEGIYQPKLCQLRQLPQPAHVCAPRDDRQVVGWRELEGYTHCQQRVGSEEAPGQGRKAEWH